MNWKFEVIDSLKMYEAKREALRNIPEEIRSLEVAAQSIRSATADGTPVQRGGSGREDRLLANIVKRQLLEQNLREAKAWVDRMDKSMAKLSDEERLILDRFYINQYTGSVSRLCEELCLEKSAVYDRREKALRHLTVIMYGRVET